MTGKMKVDLDAVYVSEKAYDALVAMAKEEGISENELIGKLILSEDRKRHVRQVPFVGDVRVKCLAFHSRCEETQERVTEHEEI